MRLELKGFIRGITALLLLIRHFYTVMLFIMEAYSSNAVIRPFIDNDTSGICLTLSQISMKTGIQVIVNKHVYTCNQCYGLSLFQFCASFGRRLLCLLQYHIVDARELHCQDNLLQVKETNTVIKLTKTFRKTVGLMFCWRQNCPHKDSIRQVKLLQV